MPYIKSGDGRREALRNGEPALTAGELNYQIFYYYKHKYTYSLCVVVNLRGFVEQFLGTKPNYQRYNDMTGALIRCSKEIERRLNLPAIDLLYLVESYDDQIAKYEDTKIIENGDVE